MLKYTMSLYTSIPFGLKALYRNNIIPQKENDRERKTAVLLINFLGGALPNAKNTIAAAHKISIGMFRMNGRGEEVQSSFVLPRKVRQKHSFK